MIKKDLKKDIQVIALSKKEIGCVAGGSFDWKKKAKEVAKAAGEAAQEANQAIDKGLRKAGEVARELNQDFQAGKQQAREEKEVPNANPQPSAPADNNTKPEL